MTTPNLKFPIWAAAQDQPWLPENETKNLIDALMPGVVVSDALTTPPGAPAAGACYIVATPATGAWAGWESQIAAYIGGAWVEISPQEGWVFWVVSNTGRSAYTGGAWVAQMTEAPTDGAAYARKDGAWAEVSLAGGMYDMEVAHAGTATASQVIFSRLLGRNAEFAANFSGSLGKIDTNPTATFDLDVQADGVSIGAISISTAGIFTFSTVGGVVKNVLAGAEIKVIAPAVVDATAADISLTIIAKSDGQTYVIVPGHRHWRILVTAIISDPNNRFAASEIEFRDAVGGADLTAPALAVASASSGSHLGANTPNLAFDDLHSSGTWFVSSGSVYVGGGEWIAWDFGPSNSKDIVEVGVRAIHLQLGLMPEGFTVQWSDDGVIWNDSWTVSSIPTWAVINELRVFTKP